MADALSSLPKLWGVINLTPDSFYAASRATRKEALDRAEAMLAHGAQRVDIGAESTRPGAIPVSAEAQREILVEFLKDFAAQYGAHELNKISVDARDLSVIERVAEFSIGAINDVSGGNRETYLFIAERKIDYVLMHTQGTPQTMQANPHYTDVVREVAAYLKERVGKLLECGVLEKHIIVDGGICFGKTVEHNLKLIAQYDKLRVGSCRLLAGVSRKSFIGKILHKEFPEDRLWGTLAIQTYLSLRGLDILRAHDVKEMAEGLKLLEALRDNEL